MEMSGLLVRNFYIANVVHLCLHLQILFHLTVFWLMLFYCRALMLLLRCSVVLVVVVVVRCCIE